ncbi:MULTISPECIES: hypothetical protein [Stenotrophomonas]|uniref:hypothetical protein n=1 Tax=Stenotrophomonas TaxID=40323 RepID=UPI001CF22500|nr:MULTISPECIES: hypothetical protein [Stenotrophomonas]MCA7023502.1 hypothetical protein [Stenotrophomonas acidaminiphila]MCE4075890.1 hypothetical protein [Stenotrophomonas acidaminiphila]
MAVEVTFIEQNAPVDERGRAMYAIARSIIRAHIDSLTEEDLRDLNTPLKKVTMRQLAKLARIERDKGIRGDGFEWAVHEAIVGGEPTVTNSVAAALKKASRSVKDDAPASILFGQERAKFLGFLDAVVTEAGEDSYLLPQGNGRPFGFGKWVSVAAKGHVAEPELQERIKKIWKTDLFLSAKGDVRHFAATIKSNYGLLEGGKGLRVGIVPESKDRANAKRIEWDANKQLWVVTLADPSGFMGLYNDAYHAVSRAIIRIGKHQLPPYFLKPTPMAQRIEDQLVKYESASALDIEYELDRAAQQDLVKQTHSLLSVNPPDWLHVKEMATKVISPKPRFERLD